MVLEARETVPTYVTSVAERKPQYRGGHTMAIPFFDANGANIAEWWTQFSGRRNFTFSSGSEGRILFNQLLLAISQRNEAVIPNLLAEIERCRIPNSDERPEVTRWGDMAIQLPGDWGPRGENRDRLKDLITSRAKGRVLEAMSGFNSYLAASPNVTEIVALDYCQEALERYEYPERTRILYDLERIRQGEGMDFFADESFDTVGVFFGVNYLTNPQVVYGDFMRIISPDGQLLIAGGTCSGYENLQRRPFRPGEIVADLLAVGFSSSAEQLPYEMRGQIGEYYLITGQKFGL